ncbi:MAG: DUF488 domain-containing protein [Hyphomicrobiales bacterium]|nr:DUF488 domain-containing protein [Hyphomicrobiales bacterium]
MGSNDSSIFFTIGHSTRPLEEFIALLLEANVQLVIDVRSVPRLRTNPQYERDFLSRELAASQIGYEHLVALGGLRGRQRKVSLAVNAYWRNTSFHNYADYAMGQGFQDALTRLRELGHKSTCTVICAEAVWWRCHRRIIADYLLAAHEFVFHILGLGKVVPARITLAARPGLRGTLTYQAPRTCKPKK